MNLRRFAFTPPPNEGLEKKNKEFQKFDKTMEQLLKVPHSKIKEELEAEKKEKKKAKEPKKKTS